MDKLREEKIRTNIKHDLYETKLIIKPVPQTEFKIEFNDQPIKAIRNTRIAVYDYETAEELYKHGNLVGLVVLKLDGTYSICNNLNDVKLAFCININKSK